MKGHQGPPVTVVIATRNRVAELRRTLGRRPQPGRAATQYVAFSDDDS